MTRRSSLGGGAPVGSAAALPDTGALLTFSDASQWLRTGSLAASAGYPQAGALEHMKAYSLTTRGTGVTWGTPRSIATNLAGIYVATDGDTTNIRRSTDGGATWNSVAHNSGGVAIHRVVWTGSVFIAVGNTATAVVVCTSTDGSAWTLRLSAVVAGYTPNSAVVATNGSNLHALITTSNSSTQGVWTSTDATNWTARNQGITLSGGGAALIAVEANRIVATTNNSLTYIYSVDGGVSWGSATLPAIGTTWQLFAINGGFTFLGNNNNTYCRATDPSASANWVAGALFGVQQDAWTQSNSQSFNSTRTTVYLPTASGFMYTSDGVTFKRSGVDAMLSQGSQNPPVAIGNGDMVVLSAASGGAPYRASVSPMGSFNAVGVLPAVATGGFGIGLPLFMRIK